MGKQTLKVAVHVETRGYHEQNAGYAECLKQHVHLTLLTKRDRYTNVMHVAGR